MRTRFLIALAVSALAICAADVARARPGADGAERVRRSRRSRSIGFPWQGRLEGGVLLEESRYVRYAGEYRDGGHFYGTDQMVHLLERAAAQVARRAPGAKLSVGEISSERGGLLAGHRSHENGRDVDVAFYMLDARGRSFEPFGFAVFGGDGAGQGANRMLRFDDVRNWELVRRLVADPDARVQHLFVHHRLRTRLLREGRRRNSPRVVLDRAAAVMVEPTHGHPHDNHFHLRIYCDPRDRPRCRDRAPFHVWYPGTPPRDAENDGVAD